MVTQYYDGFWEDMKFSQELLCRSSPLPSLPLQPREKLTEYYDGFWPKEEDCSFLPDKYYEDHQELLLWRSSPLPLLPLELREQLTKYCEFLGRQEVALEPLRAAALLITTAFAISAAATVEQLLMQDDSDLSSLNDIDIDYKKLRSFLEVDNSFLTPWNWKDDCFFLLEYYEDHQELLWRSLPFPLLPLELREQLTEYYEFLGRQEVAIEPPRAIAALIATAFAIIGAATSEQLLMQDDSDLSSLNNIDYKKLTSFLEVDNSFLTPWNWKADDDAPENTCESNQGAKKVIKFEAESLFYTEIPTQKENS